MFRNCLSAAWGDLVRSPAQSLIAIGGLAIGLMAAIIAGIVTVDAFTRDHFIPSYDRTYFAVMENHSAEGDQYLTSTSYDLADYLRALPEIEGVARDTGGPYVLSHGAFQAREEHVSWADPDFFQIYRAPALFGDVDKALGRPDGIVITLAMARKYFGYDNVVGQTLALNHKQIMTVRAVIADWPLGSNFKSTAFASSLSPASPMSRDIGTQGMSRNGGLKADMVTLVRLRPGASLDDLNRRASALVASFVPASLPYRRAMHFERVDWVNMSPRLNPDNRAHLYVMEAVALVILTLSCVNFISLSVARSAQRGLEVAVRKVAGAARGALVAQFLGEATLQVLFALCVAIALVEWSLPFVNAFLDSGAVFDYWRDPALVAGMLAGALLVGVLAGGYPALILSAFRPAAVLKGRLRTSARGAWLRQSLVALQFAALIVFLISAATVFRQNRFATSEAMRVNTDQMLMIMLPKCDNVLKDRIAALPGVQGAACSSLRVLPESQSGEMALPHGGGEMVTLSMVPVGFGFLELFGLKPDAGRFFRSENGDTVPDHPGSDQNMHYVINEAAVHQLGFASAQAAVGQALNFPTPAEVGLNLTAKPGDPPPIYALKGTIIGVVKDFSFTPEMSAKMYGTYRLPATAYSVGLAEANLSPPPTILHVKLSGRDIPETLTAIDDAWKKSGALDPIFRQFLNEYIQNRESTTLKEGQAFAVFAGLAMLLACLGLFGVSLSAATRRTKEIGVRKAMGATNRDVLALLLWQFAKPVLWANLIAWPLAWWAMNRWLSGFAYHTTLSAWLFPASGAIALLIALAAVSGQAILVVRKKAVRALRYE